MMELERERERERGLRLELSCGFGFQSRGVYIRRGMGCRLEDEDVLRGAVERFLMMRQGGVVGRCRRYSLV